MNKLLHACVLSLMVFPASGCAPETSDQDEETAEAAGELLSANALVANALVANALVANALVANALDPGALASLQDPGASGDLARQLLRYTVGCAFSSAQSFAFTWTDAEGEAHPEVYQGALGLAPGWATGPLSDETAQRLVSACLAARVNWYGVSVIISVRSSHAPLTVPAGSPELADFPHVEGAFWGNLFAPSPYLNACYRAANVAISRAAQRDCAVGHVEGTSPPVPCGMIALTGPCGASCKALNQDGHHYPACTDQPGVPGSPLTDAVITTALP